jgi:peptidoglycan/LPS O-acetylase OafA/YrhL
MNGILSLKVDYSKRVFGLDLMRAIAIINVVIVHATWMNIFPKYPWIPIIPGVELFFVLSGFLIGTILLNTFLNKKEFGLKQMAQFWKRRWFRTLPNYYLILLFNIIFVYFGIIREYFSQFNWKFFFFVQNLFSEFHGFFWESWSLTIEEWFYLSFPIILFLLNVILRKTLQKKQIFLTNIIIFLCFSVLMRLFIGSKLEIDNGFWYDVKIHKVIIYHLDGIALGLLAAYIKYFAPEFWHKSRNITFILGLTICLLMPYMNWNPTDTSTIIFKISMQSVGCFLLLPRFETIKTAPKALTKVVTHISLISYSMYLINLSMVASVITSNIQIDGKGEAVLWYAIYWIVVILASTIIYKFYEKPIMDLRDKF